MSRIDLELASVVSISVLSWTLAFLTSAGIFCTAIAAKFHICCSLCIFGSTAADGFCPTCYFWCPEIGTSFMNWAHQSRFLTGEQRQNLVSEMPF
jgi:hypothetical protein